MAATDANTASHKSPATPYCAPYIPPSPTSTASTALLSTYIHLAETATLDENLRIPHQHLFAQAATPPTLHEDRPNRILLFTGCFNPPHISHLELLLYVFLRSDSSTVAALIYAGGPDASKENVRMINGSVFGLTRDQRAMLLLRDTALGRFSWVHRSTHASLKEFQKSLVEMAGKDGFEIEWVALAGSDHLTPIHRGFDTWADSAVTSDVTRGSELLGKGMVVPINVIGCGEWTRVGEEKGGGCGVCEKFQMLGLCVEGDGCECTAHEILRRCHGDDGGVFMCERTDGKGTIWFFPSGRTYPSSKSQATISSTKIRQLLRETPQEELYDTLGYLVLNPHLLLEMLGFDTKNSDEENVCGYKHSPSEGGIVLL